MSRWYPQPLTACRRFWPHALLFGLFCCTPWMSQARAPLYGALDHPELLRCEDQHWSGQTGPARRCFQSLASDLSLPPAIRAEAFWAQGDLRTANQLFQQALNQQPDEAMIRVRWGELFLQTWQNQDAMSLFEEGLDSDPDNAWAKVGIIMALAGSDPELANTLVNQLMDNEGAPPGARLRVMLNILRITMERDDLVRAEEMLEDSRQLAEGAGLPLMEVHAYTAALAFLQRQDPQPHIDAALDEAPGYGDAWAIPAHFASITRRYREAGEFWQQAVTVEPSHWQAHVDLGQNHLRLNRIDDGIHHIRLSYEGDPYNPRTVNLLRLLDTFTEDFVTLNYPDPPQGAMPLLTLRLHRKERDVLKHYARQLAEDSIALYSERYRFTPREPIIIEIFPNHEDFVVRSLGMPGVGILGVTFGYLFAMDSPSGHPEESYHWGTTLWHEMAHVFTVEATGHGVPRWVSEGMSVYEEWQSGPIPGRKIPLEVLQAMAEGKFLPIIELDDGFMRPTYEGQVMVSYMQSGLVFEYLDDAFGYDRAVDMLPLFTEGVAAEDALEQALGVSTGTLEQGFRDWVDEEFGHFLPHLDDFQRHRRQAAEALREARYQEAVQEAEAALFIYPEYAEVDSPWIILARAHERQGNRDHEFTALQSYWQYGGWSPRALLRLGRAYIERDEPGLAEKALRDINWADPFNEDVHVVLGDLLMEQGKPDEALIEYQVLLALNPLDQASAYYRLARAYHALGESSEGMDALLKALDIAPQFRPAQRLLLEMSDNP